MAESGLVGVGKLGAALESRGEAAVFQKADTLRALVAGATVRRRSGGQRGCRIRKSLAAARQASGERAEGRRGSWCRGRSAGKALVCFELGSRAGGGFARAAEEVR